MVIAFRPDPVYSTTIAGVLRFDPLFTVGDKLDLMDLMTL